MNQSVCIVSKYVAYHSFRRWHYDHRSFSGIDSVQLRPKLVTKSFTHGPVIKKKTMILSAYTLLFVCENRHTLF